MPSVLNARFDLDQALDRLEQAGRNYREKVARFKASPEAGNYSSQGIATQVSNLKRDAVGTIEQEADAVRQARIAVYEAYEAHMASLAPTGAEGIAAQVQAGSAQDRVRRLLHDQHMEPGEIIRRALTTADRLTLEALRTEAAWATPSDPWRSWADAITARLGLGDAPGSASLDPGEAIRLAVDAALVSILPEREAEALRIKLTLDAQSGHIDRILRRATELIDTGPGLGEAIEDRAQGYSSADGFAYVGDRHDEQPFDETAVLRSALAGRMAGAS
ncbi:MAG TPA: hypothetical protein VFU19_13500 [Iamia sp.]|nr:hypothetical protein [Iamia sp.]